MDCSSGAGIHAHRWLSFAASARGEHSRCAEICNLLEMLSDDCRVRGDASGPATSMEPPDDGETVLCISSRTCADTSCFIMQARVFRAGGPCPANSALSFSATDEAFGLCPRTVPRSAAPPGRRTLGGSAPRHAHEHARRSTVGQQVRGGYSRIKYYVKAVSQCVREDDIATALAWVGKAEEQGLAHTNIYTPLFRYYAHAATPER